MSIEPKHLVALRCPVTKRPLDFLPRKSLEHLNAEIQAGNVRDATGKILKTALENALVTDTGRTIYPIEDDIPVLIEANSIATAQISDE